jgi:hypothetical protein
MKMKDKSKANNSVDERNKQSTDQTRQGQRQNVNERDSDKTRNVETDVSRSSERKSGISPKSGVTGSDYDGQVAGE